MTSKVALQNISFGEERYLIRIDREMVGVVNTLEEAKNSMDGYATKTEKELERTTGMVVFRRTIKEGQEIQLYTQRDGVFQSYLHLNHTIYCVKIPQINYISPYADKIAQYKAQKTLS